MKLGLQNLFLGDILNKILKAEFYRKDISHYEKSVY